MPLIISTRRLKVSGCGEGEIRTPEDLSALPVFETGAFDHSATSPWSSLAMLALFAKKSKNAIFKAYSGGIPDFRPYRLMVRTRPFQGCNQSSILCRVTPLSPSLLA